MGQVIVRNLDDAVIASLKAKASGASKSLEQYLREVLMQEARPSKTDLLGQLRAIRESIKIEGDPPLPEEIIREDREGRGEAGLPAAPGD